MELVYRAWKRGGGCWKDTEGTHGYRVLEAKWWELERQKRSMDIGPGSEVVEAGRIERKHGNWVLEAKWWELEREKKSTDIGPGSEVVGAGRIQRKYQCINST
ncbi:hypothetical protein Pmani_029895 [Petrolisthes manimaculis]|uniref:Uncharacterized protein n=1 Tax=Petrolisthes manimaculis TaxID=1843537 RepID=A0AAE1TU83_9EUCA|nr:hypothetical protein Pmani_029895 [Petrolisthes manimaculis]